MAKECKYVHTKTTRTIHVIENDRNNPMFGEVVRVGGAFGNNQPKRRGR